MHRVWPQASPLPNVSISMGQPLLKRRSSSMVVLMTAPPHFRHAPRKMQSTRVTPTRDPKEAHLVQAYVLIQTEVGKAALVAEEVREIPGVDSADDVTGPYDVIVKATSDDVDSLGKLVVAKIQAIDGITRTLTCPVVHL
jgi:DNA-binding Lrp family transcriptional regulator